MTGAGDIFCLELNAHIMDCGMVHLMYGRGVPISRDSWGTPNNALLSTKRSRQQFCMHAE